MQKSLVVRAGSGWGSALVGTLLEADAEVVAYSGSERKLSRLIRRYGESPRLRTVCGNSRNTNELLAAAREVDLIICGVYLTYEDTPEKVGRMVEAVREAASAAGARLVLVYGAYRPVTVKEAEPDANTVCILSPELYGAEASDTLIHYAFKRFARGRSIKRIFDPAIPREFAYMDDALRDVLHLASTGSAYGITWRLRSNGPISPAELLNHARTDEQTPPLFERAEGWKLRMLRMLRWYEPQANAVLDGYSQPGLESEASGMEFSAGPLTPYAVGASVTMERFKRASGRF